jgi:hypothetical protein
VRFLAWYDLDPRNGLARVTKKTLWKFWPKNHEERSVPLPASMIEQLLQWKAERKAAAADLVFPNTKGKPDTLHIEIVKRVAWRAKLNCGQCVSEHGYRCADGPFCERIFLHKTGVSRAIIEPKLFDKHCALLSHGRFLQVEGSLQNIDNDISLKAFDVIPLAIHDLEVRSHDFH